MITIYHNPLWSKSRKSVEILKEIVEKYQIIEYLKEGITIDELISIGKKLNLPPKDFIRKNDPIYKSKRLGSFINDDNKVFNAIVNYPKLIERPIVIKNNKAIISRPPELLYEFLL